MQSVIHLGFVKRELSWSRKLWNDKLSFSMVILHDDTIEELTIFARIIFKCIANLNLL